MSMDMMNRDLAAERPYWTAAKGALEDIEELGEGEFDSSADFEAAYTAAFNAFMALDNRTATAAEVAAAKAYVDKAGLLN